MDGGFGGVVGGRDRHGDEGEARGDCDDGCVGLFLQVREQGGGETDGAEEIGGDHRFGVGGIWGFGEVFGTHDTGIVNDDVESGVISDELCGEGANAGDVFYVERCRGHAGVGSNSLVE